MVSGGGGMKPSKSHSVILDRTMIKAMISSRKLLRLPVSSIDRIIQFWASSKRSTKW